ncbi:MAG: hypothetical protein WKG07_07620 [Hymenobacter sp.]
MLFAAFQLKFAIITPALITGGFAERIRFWGYLIFICLFSLLIYCPLAHWTWHPDGFLYKWGVLDFAGGTVVHISAGFAALAGALAIGRRRSHLDGHAHAPVNIPFVILGTGLLWFGWFGFNAGSALGANAQGGAGVRDHALRLGRRHAHLDAAGSRPAGSAPRQWARPWAPVVGLVAITPAAGYVAYGPAIAIGILASGVSFGAVVLKNRTTLDDTLDVFPCHGVGGMVGMLATALFAEKGGLFTGGGPTLLYYHLLTLLVVGVFTFGGSWILYQVTNLVVPIRVNAENEGSRPRHQPARRNPAGRVKGLSIISEQLSIIIFRMPTGSFFAATVIIAH